MPACDGVHWRCDTPWRAICSATEGPRPPGRSSWITTRPPRVRVPSSSNTDMSKQMLVIASHTPGSRRPKTPSIAANKRTALRWVTTTLLGRPVEPEV